MTAKTIAVKAVRYCWLLLTGVVCWIMLYLFNKTIIIGRENFPREKNTLVIANHQSWIDSWVITFAAVWPWIFLMPWKFGLALWHTPDRRNYFDHPMLAMMSWLSQCVPMDRDKANPADIVTATKRLKAGVLEIFPEGTRHRGKTPKERDTLRPQWLGGAAWLACLTQSEVVPIAIRGMAEVWPVGGKLWPFGKKIVIVIGKPIDMTPYWSRIGQEGFRSREHRKIMLEVSQAMKTALQNTLNDASKIFYQP